MMNATIHTPYPPEQLQREIQKHVFSDDLALRVPRSYPFVGTVTLRGFTIRRNTGGRYGRPQIQGTVEPEGSGTVIALTHRPAGNPGAVRRLAAGLGGLVLLLLIIVIGLTRMSSPLLLIPIIVVGLIAGVIYFLAGGEQQEMPARFNEDCRELERLLAGNN